MSYFDDVGKFHEKFGLPTYPDTPCDRLTADLARFRVRFMIEELAEFCRAVGLWGTSADLEEAKQNADDGRYIQVDVSRLEEAADALADLTYVVIGTAHCMGLPFEEVWSEVQRANMEKERAAGASDPRSKRQHSSDVVKPLGWRAPDHGLAIRNAIMRSHGNE